MSSVPILDKDQCGDLYQMIVSSCYQLNQEIKRYHGINGISYDLKFVNNTLDQESYFMNQEVDSDALMRVLIGKIRLIEAKTFPNRRDTTMFIGLRTMYSEFECRLVVGRNLKVRHLETKKLVNRNIVA